MFDFLKKFIRKSFTENLRLKVLAFLIASLIFALVRGGRDATTRVSVEVEVVPPPPDSDRILMTEVPEVYKLRVRGSPRVVQLVNDEEIPPVTLDLSKTAEGPYSANRSIFKLPPGLEIVSVSPASVNLRYEPRVTQKVLVRPLIAGKVVTNHHIKMPVETEPDYVTLTGPSSLVSQRENVETAPVLIDGLGIGRHKRPVNLETLPNHCKYVDRDRVSVWITVEPDTIERSFDKVLVEVRESELPAKAEPITVTVQGPPDAVEQMTSLDLHPFVLLGAEGGIPGNYRREVQMIGLSSTIGVTLIPPTVIVEVTPRPASSEDDEPAPPGPIPSPVKAGKVAPAGDIQR